MQNKNPITVKASVKGSPEKVWECWNLPEHITKWAFASEDWECPEAENDIKTGGNFKTVMAAKDGSYKFDFAGTYSKVEPLNRIEYDLGDARHVKIEFNKNKDYKYYVKNSCRIRI